MTETNESPGHEPVDPSTLSDYDFDAPATKGSGAVRLVSVALAVLAAAVVLFLDPAGWHGLDESLRGETAMASSAQETGAEDAAPLYTCPMHPQILQDEPGSCPICGMDLVLAEDGEAESAHAEHDHGDSGGDMGLPDPVGDAMSAAGDGALYTCPMHPEILQDEPGSCPICGMDLVPVDDELPAGDAPVVTIDPAVVQNMNVRIEEARRRDIERDLRAVGYLDVDPKRRVTVTTKYPGWVEKVYVHYPGEPVRRGQALFEIYAPELVQTQQELLSAVRYVESLADAPEDTRQRAEGLVHAVRTRLAYWDVNPDAVDRVIETGEVIRRLTVYSPASGVVTKRLDGLEGMAVKPGLEIFEIADLSSLWLTIELYENQVAWIDVGSEAQIELSYFPGESFAGKVRYLEPQLRAETRTLGVRVEVPNPDGRLRAGMYAEATLDPPAVEDAVTVPSRAVLRTGQRNLVVVALGNGRFQPREVLLGHEGEGYVQIVRGLEDGERVATSAQFLIDSESNLRAAIEQLRNAKTAGGDAPQTMQDEDMQEDSMQGAGHDHG